MVVVALVVATQVALPLIEGGDGGDDGGGDDNATPFRFDSFRSAMFQRMSCACTYIMEALYLASFTKL